MQLNLTSLKYKEKTSLNSKDIDWRKNCEDVKQRKLYNKYLLKLTSHNITYDTFCEAVTHAGCKTAVSIESKCEGWYKASEAILTPAIEEEKTIDYKTRPTSLMTNLPTSNFNSNTLTNIIMTLSAWPKHAGTVVYAPKYTTCDLIHALHGKISTYSPAAKPLTTKPTLKWPRSLIMVT